MCRHLAYLGPVTTVGAVLTEGSRSLVRQSWDPADMRGGGTVNADGFGAAWWSERGVLARYRSVSPVWADPFVGEGLAAIEAPAVMVALRSATEGMPVERSATAPFSDGHWAFSLNGVVRGWPGSLVSLASALPVSELLRLDAPTDAAALWLLLRSRLRSTEPGQALFSLVRDVVDLAPGSRLNMLLCNGSEIWATAWYHSLWARVDESAAIVSSEPFDDDRRWHRIPDRHLVDAVPGKLVVTPLEAEAS